MPAEIYREQVHSALWKIYRDEDDALLQASHVKVAKEKKIEH
jgi:hypothetical protein